jgi:two-component system phosphate regulon sensor histidine kinase PhoR
MNKEILVVDDEKYIRELCRDILEAEGYSVEMASNGEEALQKMRQFNFVIYIIDIIMPGIDGLELISRIKKREPLAVIIVTTGFSSIEGAVKAVHAGAFQYLSKPLSAPELLQTVKKGLEFYNFLYGPLTKTIEPVKEVDKLHGIILFNNLSENTKNKINNTTTTITFSKEN